MSSCLTSSREKMWRRATPRSSRWPAMVEPNDPVPPVMATAAPCMVPGVTLPPAAQRRRTARSVAADRAAPSCHGPRPRAVERAGRPRRRDLVGGHTTGFAGQNASGPGILSCWSGGFAASPSGAVATCWLTPLPTGTLQAERGLFCRNPRGVLEHPVTSAEPFLPFAAPDVGEDEIAAVVEA